MNKQLLLCEVEWAPAAIVTGASGGSADGCGSAADGSAEGCRAGMGGSVHDGSAGVPAGVGDRADDHSALMGTPSCLASLRVRTFLAGTWGAGKEHGLHSL